MISGISHVTLLVRDLPRAAALFTDALDAREVYASGDDTFSLARERFFLLGGLWLCLMEGTPPDTRSYAHIALQAPEEELSGYRARLIQAGAEILPGRPRIGAEGQSVYFYDFDNHLFELHSGNLEARLMGYTAAAPARKGTWNNIRRRGMEQTGSHFAEALKAMGDLYGQDVPMSLATDDDGSPNVRVIDVYFLDGAFYAVTHMKSCKMREIAKNPRVALNHVLFVARGEAENLGHPRAPGNEALRLELMRAFHKFYSRHVNEDDPDTCILKIAPGWALLFANDCKYIVDFKEKAATCQPFVADIQM